MNTEAKNIALVATGLPPDKTTLRLPGRAGVSPSEALANLARFAHSNKAPDLMAECHERESKQRDEIARTPVRAIERRCCVCGGPANPLDTGKCADAFCGANTRPVAALCEDEMETKIVRELAFSIRATTCTFNEKTGEHTTDGTFTIAVDEGAYSESQGRRTALPNDGRMIAWEPTHPTYESALHSALMHLAQYRIDNRADHHGDESTAF